MSKNKDEQFLNETMPQLNDQQFNKFYNQLIQVVGIPIANLPLCIVEENKRRMLSSASSRLTLFLKTENIVVKVPNDTSNQLKV